MGPVESLFIVLILLFGMVGVVRSWERELGVTTMLLISLFLIIFLFGAEASGRITGRMSILGMGDQQVTVLVSLLAVLLLLVIAFISYQGIGLTYPGSGKKPTLSLAVGLINGYLLAGSIWYYLARADWPMMSVVPTYSAFYNFFVRLLPPAIFGWQFFILLAVAMLIFRVIK